MKNKIKSVVSSLLTVALLFSALIGVFPMRAAAARAAVTATAEERTAVEIKKIVDATRDYAYDSAQECLEAELMAGYLDGVVSADRSYSIYVNRYTGMLYYRNNLTGQILTSNPYQFTGQSKNSIAELMSQISVEFSLSDRIGEKRTYNSYEWAAAYAQIATYFIENGIRVSYTIGDTTSRFFLPGRITRESFENYFLVPMITQFEQIIMERFPETGMTFFNNEVEGEYKPYDAYVDGCINTSASTSVKTRYYGDGTSEKIGPGLRAYLTKMQALYYPLSGTDPDRIALVQLTSDINTILNCFSVINLREFENQPAQEKTYEEYKEKYYSDPSLEIYETLEPFYAYTSTGSVTADRLNAKLLLRYAESYADHHDGETFTNTNPLVLIDVVLLFYAMEQQVLAVLLDIAESRVNHFGSSSTCVTGMNRTPLEFQFLNSSP